ncbi:tRNA(His) guanylyltransferase Thg1 family protein [Lacrimispora amygdalina]|uniref:tRNA(His) guanylyltransferase Thg1 family protein n=1 Tax=Lacrimispora amygdalina TaxID=253257 RepID=UPI000BE2C389|nr:tRNA(His) guanylyltransferase Thg1 family protein [Lacrimispora amygdalina]
MKSLEERMKRYEAVSDNLLPIRVPVIIRLDGWHFKSFTKGLEKPFDLVFRETMVETMLYLCKELPGVVFGYTQSDEISLILCDYQSLETEPWFDNRLNKLLSIPAGLAAVKFNSVFKVKADNILDEAKRVIYNKKSGTAIFDARAFVVPENDVINYLYWRQKDAIRNSIANVGQTYLSKTELHKKNTVEILGLLKEKSIIWDDYDTWLTRGACAVKELDEGKEKMEWKIDKNIPIFKEEGRDYVSKWIPVS